VLGFVLGRARVLAPLALAAGGAALLLAPLLAARAHDGEAPQPGNSRLIGAVLLFAALTLALAAGMAGISAPRSGAASTWSSTFLHAHGGLIGEALYALANRLVSQLGVDILVVFLLLAGGTLVTGASLPGAIRALARVIVRVTARVVGALLALAAARKHSLQETGAAAAGAPEPEAARGLALAPPEPSEQELIVRSTHLEGPSQETEEFAAREPADGEREGVKRSGAAPARAGAAARQDDGEAVPEGAGEDELTPRGRLRDSVTEDPAFEWKLPEAGKLLTRSTGEQARPDTAGQSQTAARLLEALGHFNVQANVIGTVAGPHITRYELRLAPGTKMANVAKLKDDLAYALAATDIRILAPIPGKQAVGVEVPNADRRIVRLGDVFQEPPPDSSPLTVWLGKDVAGKAIGADLAKMPHLLVAGTTGAGKSAAINAMLSSVLLRATPHEVRLVLVDPKQVELNHYESIPHLLTPVITSPRMAANALQNLVKEMEQRYGIMSLARTRGLIELNRARGRRGEAPLPYILCVIDELADLMMVAPADVEDSIIRLAQKARAVGIHLVLATQSPRVDVITGMIKANVPSRIAFAVSSQTDSRVILDQNGAESLLGQGDMLFSPLGSSRLQRIQGAYIDERQIALLTELWRKQGEPELREELLEEVESEVPEAAGDELDPDEDPLLRDAIVLVAEMQTASTSMLQRRLRLGYTRAGRVIDMLERRSVISGYEGSKPRQVLITEADLPRVLAMLAEPAATTND